MTSLERPREWTPETIAPLLERWDERLRSEVGRFDELSGEAVAANSILRPPASEAEIQTAEERLQVQLPPAYRSFLLVSNGAHASSLGAEVNNRRSRFLPVAEVERAAETEKSSFYVKVWTEDEVLSDPANDIRPLPGESSEVGYFAPMRRALLVSEPDEVFRDMLVPREGEREWEFWACAKEYSVAYRSFGDFLLAELARPSCAADAGACDDYVRQIREGKLQSLHDLAQLGDPRTGQLACEILARESPPADWQGDAPLWERQRAVTAGHTLALLADPQFIPVLRTAYERAQGPDMRREALWALSKSGAQDASQLLTEAALADPSEDVRFAAVSALGERHYDQHAKQVLEQVAQTDASKKVTERAAEYLRTRSSG